MLRNFCARINTNKATKYDRMYFYIYDSLHLIYGCVNVYMYENMYAMMFVCMCVCMGACLYPFWYACLYGWMNVQMCDYVMKDNVLQHNVR